MKLNNVENVMKKILNKKLWSINAGQSTGSVLSLNIGKKIKRSKVVKNKSLSKDARLYKGEFCIFIMCSWRLMSENKVICTCKDSNVKRGPMLRGLNKILNQSITSLEISKSTIDLSINFENKISLYCFCDEPDAEQEDFDYCIFTPNMIYTIGPKGKITIEDAS